MVGKAAAEERTGQDGAGQGRAGQGGGAQSRGRILTRWMGWERNGEWDDGVGGGARKET